MHISADRHRVRSHSDPNVTVDAEAATASTALVLAGDGTGIFEEAGMSTPPRKCSSGISSAFAVRRLYASLVPSSVLSAVQSDPNMSTPPRKSSTALVNSTGGSLVPSSSSVLSSVQCLVGSVSDLLRAKSQVEHQIASLLQRMEQLCEPMATLLGSLGASKSLPAGVQKTLKAMQKKSFAHSPIASAASSLSAPLSSPPSASVSLRPGGAVPAPSSDALLHAQVCELRSARDSLSVQLSAQMERVHLLIKDKIHLAKKIEETYEERTLVVENLREEIAALRANQGAAAEQVPHAPLSSSTPHTAVSVTDSSADDARQRHDSALGDTTPAGSGANGSLRDDLRTLNSYYVSATAASRADDAASAAAAAAAASNGASPTDSAVSAERGVSEVDEPFSSDEEDQQAETESDEDSEDFDDGPLIVTPQPQQGLLSSLLSFFRVRSSQSEYQQALMEAQRRRRAALIKRQQLKAVALVL